MNTLNHGFAAAAMALIMALVAGSALAIAPGNNHSINAQDEATNQATSTYPSNQGMEPSDQSAGSISAPNEQSSQTYGSSDNTKPNDANASEAPGTEPSTEAVVRPTYPAVIAAPDEPRYVPETGNAEYGSKLMPYDRTLRAEPPARFNDATGQ